MSISDPISDMFVRIRNGQAARKSSVTMPASKVKTRIAELLKAEGYIRDFALRSHDGKSELEIELKYFEGRPVIDMLKRVSRPGLRQYRGASQLPKVLNGLGVAIVSTSQGIMTDAEARQRNLGGEVICLVA